MRVGSRTLADRPLRQRRFQLRVALPPTETTVQVVTIDDSGRRSRASVQHVLGASRCGVPRLRAPHVDALLQRRCAARRGASAARARSTSRISQPEPGPPGTRAQRSRRRRPSSSPSQSRRSRAVREHRLRGSTLDRLLREMLTYSDNAAANSTERYFGGSTSGGSALVNTMMRSLRLVDTEMYGGYELDRGGRPHAPSRGDSAPGRQPAELGDTASGRVRTTSRRCCASCGSPAAGAGPSVPRNRGSARPTRAICSICSRTCATPASSTARSGGCPACACSTRQAGSTALGTTTGSCSGREARFVVTVMTYRSAGAGIVVGRSRRPGRDGRAASLPRLAARRPEDTVGARKRAPTMLAVTPSECATAAGVRSREAIFGKPDSRY